MFAQGRLKILILLFGLGPVWAFAEGTFRRNVDFEWEPIATARSYDLELQKLSIENSKPAGPALKLKADLPQWSGPLVPGTYQMRVRARDTRNVPGAWSPPEAFKVGLETVKITSPKAQQKIETDKEDEASVEFKWSPVGGAEKYVVTVMSADGAVRKEKSVSSAKVSVDLPISRNYTWKVKAVGMGLESDNESLDQFVLLGAKLTTPEIQKPESSYVREISWTRPSGTQDFAYIVQRFNSKTKQWENIAQGSSVKENRIQFDPKWPGGKYKLALKAKGNLRPSSDKVEVAFTVKNGDRSPAAEEVATVRQSIDRLTGWYGIASYLVTIMNFSGQNFDQNSASSFSGIGGTGRLGLGNLSANSNWGFLGILDMSGIVIDGYRNYTFASSEFGAVYRTNTSDRGEIRQHFGGFYKELPELIMDHNDGSLKGTNQLAFGGLHYGVEYWYALTSKAGFQVNAHLYPNLMKIKTPNSQNLSDSGSFQFGFLGSYRLRKNVTGLGGYAYRMDEVRYRSSDSGAVPGQVNSAEIQGHYLNLFLEWAL